MKIEIGPKSEYKDTFFILVDGEPWKMVHQAVFGRRPSLPKVVESLEEWNQQFQEIEYRLAKNYVLRRLSMQSYYSAQLEKLLIERCIQRSTVKRLIEECQEWGYLNDEAWLESFMRTHLQKSSRRTIAAKLYAKGVPSDRIQESLDQWQHPEGERQAIERIIQGRYRSRNLKDYKERQKVIGALMRKGYSFDSIQAVIGTLSSNER